MRKRLLVVLVSVMAFAVLVGCEGKMYVKPTPLDNGYTVIQGGRTGVFGTDNSFVYVAPPATPMPIVAEVKPAVIVKPEKIKLERTYTKSSTSWSNCKDKTPNKRAKNIKRQEVTESWTEEALSRPVVQQSVQQTQVPVQAPQAVFWAGGNPSTGNLALPAAFIAGGMVGAAHELRPDRTNINQSGGGASSNATGGAGGNGGVANSHSEAASASSAASNSSAWQNQDQSLKNKTGVDINID